MTSTTFAIIIGFIVLVFLTAWLFRSLVKFVVLAFVIYLLFHIGFIWGFEEANKTLKLDKFLKPEVSEQLESKYDGLKEKREEYAVLNTYEMKKAVDEVLAEAWIKSGETYEEIDKEALIQNLKAKFPSYSQEEIDKAIEQMESELNRLKEKK